MDFSNIFPDELLLIVYSLLKPNDLLKSTIISYNWNRITNDFSLWKRLRFQNRFRYVPDESGQLRANLVRVLNIVPQEVKTERTSVVEQTIQGISRGQEEFSRFREFYAVNPFDEQSLRFCLFHDVLAFCVLEFSVSTITSI